MHKKSKVLIAVAAAGLVAVGGSAFTNSNTVAASEAGSGTTAIGAYTTSNIEYHPNATNPENLQSVKFTLNTQARYVAIRTHTGGSWFRSDDGRLNTGTVNSCTTADNLTWTCDVSGATPLETVVAADSLTVVATD